LFCADASSVAPRWLPGADRLVVADSDSLAASDSFPGRALPGQQQAQSPHYNLVPLEEKTVGGHHSHKRSSSRSIMRCCSTFALAVLALGAVDALDACDSNVLVDAYAGLNVNTQLVSCMTKNNFAAALDGSVDLTSVNAASAPEQVTTICASDDCKTVLSALVGSANFNLTNCIVGTDIVLMTEITNLQATCTALDTTTAPSTTAPATTAPSTTAPVATTAAPVSTTATPVSTTAAPVSTTATPVSTTATPVATTATPVSTTATPVSTTATPESTTATPVSTTATPVATTATPVATTTAPVSTATPASTTAAPTEAPETTSPSSSTQQQDTTFSVLDSDSASAAGVSPGKYCEK